MGTYRIVRFYSDQTHKDNGKIIKEGLTLKEAKEHCTNEDTQKPGVWFDGFTDK